MEANIIAHQMIEAQKRTLDETKRRRLSNVLVNGLCASKWDKVKHRLLVRLTAELEEEHIEMLRREARTPAEIMRELPLASPSPYGWTTTEELIEQRAIATALERELIARGLLNEVTKPKVGFFKAQSSSERRAVEKVELETRISISPLGRDLLSHLKDPELASGA